MSKYQVHAKFRSFPKHAVYECPSEDDLQEALWLIGVQHGTVTWIGERCNLGLTPNGRHMMYEYREIKEAYK